MTTTTLRGRAIQRMARRLAHSWNASLAMTAQQRADAYVARTPLAVLAD